MSIRRRIVAAALASAVFALSSAYAQTPQFPPIPERKLALVAFSEAPESTEPCTGQPAELAAFEVGPGQTLAVAIGERLSASGGSADRGAVWTADPAYGNCIACHQTPNLAGHIPAGEPRLSRWLRDHGTLGPSLAGVAARYSEAELRLLVVNPRLALPDTVMPAYHRIAALSRVSAACAGRPILSAQQVEDVVAFLMTLGEPAPDAR